MNYTKQIFKALLLVCIISFTSCESNDDTMQEDMSENTIIGRWNPIGFETTVLYEFTQSLRHTIYSTDGTFGALDTAIPNPNTWVFEGDELVIDLNFGNFLRTELNFKCDGNVVEFVDAEGTVGIILFREGYDYASCTE